MALHRGALALLLLLAGCVRSYVPPAPPRPWAPWDADHHSDEGGAPGLADSLLRGYQGYLRRPGIPGRSQCRFHPSCSRFARVAYQVHGFWLGTAMTFNRLFVREPFAPQEEFLLVRTPNGVFAYDPAE